MGTRSRRGFAWAPAVLAQAVLAVACAGPAGPSATPTTATPSAPAIATARPSVSPVASLAPTASPAAARLLEPVLGPADDQRRVRVYVPVALPAAAVPLVLFLHASGETPSTAVRDTRFDALAAEAGFIAAFPPAGGRAWTAQVTPGLSDGDVDERYLDSLLDQLVDEFPIDPTRIYVAGFSIGAVMAERVACRFADRIAAAAVVSGAPWIGRECAPSRPVSMLVVHGTGDTTFRYPGAERLVETWRDLDSCPPAASPVPSDAGASVSTTTGCAEDTSVQFVTVEDGWHTWFTAPDATALAWRFFVDHGRR